MISEQKLMDCINTIKQIQENIQTLSEEEAERELIINNIKYKESEQIVGKNKEMRDAKLLIALSDNQDYMEQNRKLKELKKTIAHKKIELNYATNLLSVYKILSRLEFANAYREMD